MKKLRILFFGGTLFNYKVALKCRKLGATCFFSDMNKNCFVSKKNVNFVNINFNNRKHIINYIKKKKINFLYSTQSDIGIRSLGYINSKLKLKGTSYSLAKTLTDKVIIREKLTKYGFNQPKFISTLNVNRIKNFLKSGNYFIKPSDSSGSRGVSKLKNKSNIKNYVKRALSFSRSKKIIIEEKISGLEFGAQTFSIDGKCKYVYLHDDYMSSNNPNIPIGHSMPCFSIGNKLKENKIKDEIKIAVEKLNVQNGPCNIDCILTKENKMYILEVSPRMGATCLPDIVKLYSGADWDINAIKVWNKLKIKKFKEKNIVVLAKVFENYLEGVIKKITIGKKPTANKIVLFVRKGEKIEKFTDGSKLFGYTLTHGRNLKKMLTRTDKLLSSINISIE